MGSWFHEAIPRAAVMLMLAGTAAMAQGDKPDPATGAEASFIADNDAAMTKMMNGMQVNASSDVDNDLMEAIVLAK